MEKTVLFINACVRKESRTRKPAEKLLHILDKPYKEICIGDIAFPVVNEEFLGKRDRLIAEHAFQDPMFDLARGFSE